MNTNMSMRLVNYFNRYLINISVKNQKKHLLSEINLNS
jgi:hypothetical protein